MKAIKHILILSIVATVTFCFTSCGDDTYVPEEIVEIETPGGGEEPGSGQEPGGGEEPGGGGEEPGGEPSDLPTAVYFLSFEDTDEDIQIIGKGEFIEVEDDGFGWVFRNSADGRRENYLLLPDHILSHSSATREMTISMWVNATYAGESGSYAYTPLFTAYSSAPVMGADGLENGMPMLALQYRCLLQINNNGWCDFTGSENVAGGNTEYFRDLDWLADGKWHYYAATFTETSAIVYVDGKIMNEWALTGDRTANGLCTNGDAFTYICLGGNQAWAHPDNDNGFMYDDLAIYDKALTRQEIEAIMKAK